MLGRKAGNKGCYLQLSGGRGTNFKNISFATEPGEVTAIIGSTGSGKSTLVNLILRFYDVDSGSIKIDGVDIREMKLEELRKNCSCSSKHRAIFRNDH